ncbi:unnamed protein product [Urochloa decumbens]|uniref:Uncharacterized protein n=1 Tax=Urochloa decumbens TaxID=240449 RepID=A0ABC9FBX9_9POAL
MAGDDAIHGASWEETFQWQRPPRPDEPEVRDVAVDPFSLRQFSRLDIDRPLPIPSVSVHDRRVSLSPARLDDAASAPGAAASSSPPASITGGIKAPAASTGFDVDGARPAPPKSKVSAGSWEAELAAAGLDVSLTTSSPERKAREPQRWGSDVPLIAAAVAEDYSFGYASKHGRGNKHAGRAPPFTCCMYVPGLTRRIKSPTPPTAARSYTSPGTFGKTAAAAEPGDHGACSARHSTVSLAVSLERFDCGSLSSSPRGFGLDGGGGGEDAASPSSASCFDLLPLELILGCDGDESDMPVCAAFLFDSDGVRKSVLKRRLEAGTGMEPRRPSLGKVSVDASGGISAHQVRVSLKSRSPEASTSDDVAIKVLTADDKRPACV